MRFHVREVSGYDGASYGAVRPLGTDVMVCDQLYAWRVVAYFPVSHSKYLTLDVRRGLARAYAERANGFA